MYYAIPNVSALRVFEIEKPWEFKPDIPAQALTTKNEFKKWYSNPGTEHCHYSGFEGMDAHSRIRDDNPVVFYHAIVVDYDAAVDLEESIKRLKTKCPVEFMPNWITATYSGNARLIWELPKKLIVNHSPLLKAFQETLIKHLKLNKFLPGFDKPAFMDPSRYYEIGSKWTRLSEKTIPENFLQKWLFEAGRTIAFEDVTYKISMEAIAQEVEVRWPGRWQGTFELGKLGVRFWDPHADCPTGCIVREHGMQCFTGPKAWVPWAEIFGKTWVEQFEANKIGELRKQLFFDGATYWQWLDDKTFRSMTETVLKRQLKVMGISDRKIKGSTSTEMDRVLHDIEFNCTVVRALPFVHHPPGPIRYNNKLFLNTATAKCMAPAPEGSVAHVGDHFPWIWEFLSSFFEPIPPDTAGGYSQLEYFLAWLRWFYEGGLLQQPKPGQALVIAGPTGKGKTFLTNGLIGTMVGGKSDASNYLVEQSRWTDTVAQEPLMCIDDQIAASTHQSHMRFSALIKKVVANRTMSYDGKWAKTGDIIWVGRVALTTNLDPESLKILPNLELSAQDKISLFKAANHDLVLPGFYAQEEILKQELPYFCRWLLDWKIPEGLLSTDPRFGTKPYHHHELFESSMRTGLTSAIFELIQEFLIQLKAMQPERVEWSGSASQLFTDMAAMFPLLMAKYTTQQLSTALGYLMSRGYNVKQHRTTERNIWAIPIDLKLE